MRRQHGNIQPAAFFHIRRNLACGCEHTCEQRGHIFFRIVIFEVRRAIRHNGIRGGMGLIERVGRETFHLIVDCLGGLLVHTAGDAAFNLHGAVLTL